MEKAGQPEVRCIFRTAGLAAVFIRSVYRYGSGRCLAKRSPGMPTTGDRAGPGGRRNDVNVVASACSSCRVIMGVSMAVRSTSLVIAAEFTSRNE